jgi:membrane-bound lytic murein transglycosylase F
LNATRRARTAALLFALCTLGSAATAAPSQAKTQFDEYFRKYTKHSFGIGSDWNWFKSQAMAESNLNPNAKSWVHAKGLMQLMPATYAELQRKNPELGAIDEPRWNIAAGIAYDKQLWDRYIDVTADAERRRFMFGAYNAGAQTIRRARQEARDAGQSDAAWQSLTTVAPKVPNWRHAETLGYITRIESNRAQLAPP